MIAVALKIVFVIALPVIVFISGVKIMSFMSGHDVVEQLIKKNAELDDQQPLNTRCCYDKNDVDKHWGAFVNHSNAVSIKQRHLELDLVFPFFYGAALAISLLMVWAMLGRPFNAGWVLAPVVITLLADWTENLVQLTQLQRYAESGVEGLSENWIRVSSTATFLKLGFFAISSLLIGAILIYVISRFMSRTKDEDESPTTAN